MIKPLLSACAALLLFTTSSGQIGFTDQTASLTDPTHYSGNAVTVHDVNGDGLDDIVILDDAKNLKIEFQQPDGTWTSYTGGEMDDQNAWGMVVADMDNNGWADIISGVNGDNPDYAKANSDGTNWTISNLSGYPLFYQGSSIADIDQDGDLDLYVCADTDESAIWENDGNGNLTYSTSLINLSVNGWDGSGNYGSNFTDFDLDGDLDLYISHCRQGVTDPTDPRRINQLFENDGNNNYTENASAYGLDLGTQTWTSDFGDIDNDGDFDIIQTNHDVNNMLLENLDDSDQYENIFDSAIGTQAVGFPIQSVFKDFDNDGFIDLIITGNSHALYHNNGDLTFTLVSDAFDGPEIESLAVGDLNHDGFLDVYASYAQIYNNPSNTPDRVWINEGNDNHFITVVLEGTISNHDAIGTVVRAYGSWGIQVREVRAGESYGINNSLHTHFGLGAETQIDSLVIDWPSSGIHQVIDSPEPDQFISVIENECIAPAAIVSTTGSPILCPGESLVLNAGDEPNATYLWSNGEETSSITVTEGGFFSVVVTDIDSGCSSTSSSIEVLQSPDETPSVTVSGEVDFCEGGTLILSSSSADSYIWNTDEETSEIEVTTSGEYSVTIEGACGNWTSEVITVSVVPSPTIVPDESIVLVTLGAMANLGASTSGDEVRWYDAEVGGSLLSTGEDYTTTEITGPTSFWAEGVSISGGGIGEGGKETNSNGQYFNDSDRYLYFDAYQEFIIDEVRVYCNSPNTKTFSLYDGSGQAIESVSVYVPNGESYIALGLTVPVGDGYSVRVTGAANMWRDNDDTNVNYPYPIATYGSITGANVSSDTPDQYYYYFYDWHVSLPTMGCLSDREELLVDILTGIEELGGLSSVSTYPNPVEDMLHITFNDLIEGNVRLELTDVSGKVILTTDLKSIDAGTTKQIDLSTYSTGIYLLNLTSDEGQMTERIEIR